MSAAFLFCAQILTVQVIEASLEEIRHTLSAARTTKLEDNANDPHNFIRDGTRRRLSAASGSS